MTSEEKLIRILRELRSEIYDIKKEFNDAELIEELNKAHRAINNVVVSINSN